MRACVLCEHRCGADRSEGPAGRCRAPAEPRVFAEYRSIAEEREFIPAHVVELSGCNLACAFCIVGRASRDASIGRPWDPDGISERARGARCLWVQGGEPTVFLPALLALRGAVVLKTNLYVTPETLDVLRRGFAAVVADFKFGNDACADRLAGARRYTSVLRRNLALLADWPGLRVRHLVMPNHVECCSRPVVEWCARNLPPGRFSIREGYIAAFEARRVAEVARTATRAEGNRARALWRAAG